MKIEFVSYTGKWPCLCSGILTLRVDGREYSFGLYCNYKRFWYTTGSCGFRGEDSDSYIEKGEWACDGNLPAFLKDHEEEIMDLFNENVDYGCCGGCL